MVTPPSGITESWKRLIQYTKNVVPFGEISVQIVNGEPLLLISARRSIRFDRDEGTPSLPSILED